MAEQYSFSNVPTVLSQVIASYLPAADRFDMNNVERALRADLNVNTEKLARLQELQWSCTGLLDANLSYKQRELKLDSVGLRTIDLSKEEIIALENAVASLNSPLLNIEEDDYEQLRLSFFGYQKLREEYAYLDMEYDTWPGIKNVIGKNKKKKYLFNTISKLAFCQEYNSPNFFPLKEDFKTIPLQIIKRNLLEVLHK